VVQEAALRGLGRMFQLLEGNPVRPARTFPRARLVRNTLGRNGDYSMAYLYLITLPEK